MKLTETFFEILRDVPKSIESKSGRLLIKLGLIKKHGKGLYFFTPFGMNILNSLKKLITEEFKEINSLEIDLPILSLKGSLNDVEYLKTQDADNKEFLVGGPESYIYENFFKSSINSYKDMPLALYSFSKKIINNNKASNELLDPIETLIFKQYFIEEEKEYNKKADIIKEKNINIYDTLGISPKIINKDKESLGVIYGIIHKKGREKLGYCKSCDKYYDLDYINILHNKEKFDESLLDIEEIKTPDIKTIEALKNFTSIDIKKLIKAILIKVVDKNYVVFVRGDREVSNKKLARLLKIDKDLINPATEEDIKNIGTFGGFIGPIGLKNCEIIIDNQVKTIVNGISGANKIDYHIKNINYGRDYKADISGDIIKGSIGDKCPSCNFEIKEYSYYKIGEIKTYDETNHHNINYINKESKDEKAYIIENFIDLFKTISVTLEEDEKNIIKFFPWDIHILLLKPEDVEIKEMGIRIYENLLKSGKNPLLDDRNIKIGHKFKEAEILGIENQIVLGKISKEGKLEYLDKRKNKKTIMQEEEIYNMLNISN